ncbi:hypothetical protein OROMI_020308 [Orobanche minor]
MAAAASAIFQTLTHSPLPYSRRHSRISFHFSPKPHKNFFKTVITSFEGRGTNEQHQRPGSPFWNEFQILAR